MAATYRTSVAGGGTSGTTDRTVAITPAVNDLFIVFCSASVNTNTTPTCSDNNGGTYTLVDARLFNASANTGSVFVRNQLLANTTSTTVTVATGSNTAAEIVVVAYAGMLRTGTNGAIRSNGGQTNQAASTTPAPALNQSALTGNPTITCVCNGTGAGSVALPNASWTERQDASQSTPTTGIEVATRDSGFTGTTITYGGTSASAFCSFAIELDSSTPPFTATGSAGVSSLAGTGNADKGHTASGAGALSSLANEVPQIKDVLGSRAVRIYDSYASGTWTDIVGANNATQATGGRQPSVTTSTGGHSILTFDGAGDTNQDFLSGPAIGSLATFDSTGYYLKAFVLKAGALSAENENIITRESAAGDERALIVSGGKLNYNGALSDSAIASDGLYHRAVFVGAAATNTVKLYLDGTLQTTTGSGAASVMGSQWKGATSEIGARGNGTGDYGFAGDLMLLSYAFSASDYSTDDIAAIDRALNAALNGGSSGVASNTAGTSPSASGAAAISPLAASGVGVKSATATGSAALSSLAGSGVGAAAVPPTAIGSAALASLALAGVGARLLAAPSPDPSTVYGADLAHWWFEGYSGGLWIDQIGGANADALDIDHRPTTAFTVLGRTEVVFADNAQLSTSGTHSPPVGSTAFQIAGWFNVPASDTYAEIHTDAPVPLSEEQFAVTCWVDATHSEIGWYTGTAGLVAASLAPGRYRFVVEMRSNGDVAFYLNGSLIGVTATAWTAAHIASIAAWLFWSEPAGVDIGIGSPAIAYKTTDFAAGVAAAIDDVLETFLLYTSSGAGAFSPLAGGGASSQTQSGSGAAALSSFAGTGPAAQSQLATGAGAFSPLAGTGAAAQSQLCTGAAALSSLAGSGAGAQSFAGAGAAALSPLAGSGISGSAGPYTGTGAAAFSSLAGTGSASQDFTGAGAAAFSSLAANGAGTKSTFGSGAAAFAPLAGSGNVVLTFSSSGGAALSTLAAAGSAGETYQGAGSGVIASLAASGAALELFTGAGAAAFSSLAGSGAAVLNFLSSGSAAFAALAGTGSSHVPTIASGSAAFSSLAILGTSVPPGTETADGGAALSPFAASGTLVLSYAASGSATLSPLAASSTGAQSFACSGSGTLSPLAGTGGSAQGFTSAGSAAFSPLGSSGDAAFIHLGVGTALLSSFTADGLAPTIDVFGEAALGSLAGQGVGSVVPLIIPGQAAKFSVTFALASESSSTLARATHHGFGFTVSTSFDQNISRGE